MFHIANSNENFLETFESFPNVIPKNMFGWCVTTRKIAIQIPSVINCSVIDRLVLLECFLY